MTIDEEVEGGHFLLGHDVVGGERFDPAQTVSEANVAETTSSHQFGA